MVWQGIAKQAWQGRAGFGRERLGKAGVARQVGVGKGLARRGRRGMERPGLAWYSKARQAWHGQMRTRPARLGRAGEAGQGKAGRAWFGMIWSGEVWPIWQGRRGMTRLG